MSYSISDFFKKHSFLLKEIENANFHIGKPIYQKYAIFVKFKRELIFRCYQNNDDGFFLFFI